MPWTDVYPIFDDDLADQYLDEATEEERSKIEEMYVVASVHNSQDKPHIVSFSLFWKPVNVGDESYPKPNREILENATELGHAPRHDPWKHYVEPLLTKIPELCERFPEVSFRVHLASDLEFLLSDLVDAGCEVHLMKHPSLAFAPGGLWRFLPIEEGGKLVTISDIDRMEILDTDIERTQHMAAADLGSWKVPVWMDLNEEQEVCYLPYAGCQSGWKGGMPVRELLESFTWQSQQDAIPKVADIPHCGPHPVTKTQWPNYGFDEWFLATAMYPRAAQDGLINFVPSGARSMLLMLDVEYATWANSMSELIFFPSSGNCC